MEKRDGIQIKGQVKNSKKVSINNIQIEVNQAGRFYHTYNLTTLGKQSIVNLGIRMIKLIKNLILKKLSPSKKQQNQKQTKIVMLNLRVKQIKKRKKTRP